MLIRILFSIDLLTGLTHCLRTTGCFAAIVRSLIHFGITAGTCIPVICFVWVELLACFVLLAFTYCTTVLTLMPVTGFIIQPGGLIILMLSGCLNLFTGFNCGSAVVTVSVSGVTCTSAGCIFCFNHLCINMLVRIHFSIRLLTGFTDCLRTTGCGSSAMNSNI